MKGAGLIVVLVALLAFAAGAAWSVWDGLEGVEMGLHGIIAMAAGIVVSLGLGIGLMWLVFRSERDGVDRG